MKEKLNPLYFKKRNIHNFNKGFINNYLTNIHVNIHKNELFRKLMFILNNEDDLKFLPSNLEVFNKFRISKNIIQNKDYNIYVIFTGEYIIHFMNNVQKDITSLEEKDFKKIYLNCFNKTF